MLTLDMSMSVAISQSHGNAFPFALTNATHQMFLISIHKPCLLWFGQKAIFLARSRNFLPFNSSSAEKEPVS
jgi:hypothetical protein